MEDRERTQPEQVYGSLPSSMNSRHREREREGERRRVNSGAKAMADVDETAASRVQPKKRTFKKFSFRGVDLDALLDMSSEELVELFHARARRRFSSSSHLPQNLRFDCST